jgi:hypothetical protein
MGCRKFFARAIDADDGGLPQALDSDGQLVGQGTLGVVPPLPAAAFSLKAPDLGTQPFDLGTFGGGTLGQVVP